MCPVMSVVYHEWILEINERLIIEFNKCRNYWEQRKLANQLTPNKSKIGEISRTKNWKIHFILT